MTSKRLLDQPRAGDSTHEGASLSLEKRLNKRAAWRYFKDFGKESLQMDIITPQRERGTTFIRK